MTWAVLFLVVAYSPIGRPDLYVGTSYYNINQGVNFKEGIVNAPKGTTNATEEGESEIADYTPTSDNNANFSGNASEYSSQSTNSRAPNYSRTTESDQGSTQNSSIILADNTSKGSAAQGAAAEQSNDASSLSSDLTLTSSASTDRQAAAPNKPNGGRDPGGKNPKNPIPVGDGVWFLIITAGVYAFWRKHQTTKINTKAHK